MKFFVLTSILLLVSAEAEAYKLYKTSSGKHVRWSTSLVEIVLDDSMAELGDKESVEAVVHEALNLWIRDAKLPLSFQVVWDECNEISNDGNNCVFACLDRETCFSRPEEKGGTTYINVTPSTGYITDVDIVLNADDWKWDVHGKHDDDHDRDHDHGLCLGRVLSHEFGHFLGIDHSEKPDAIMYAMLSRNAQEASSLHYDDVDAAETLYENFVDIEEDSIAACSVTRVGAAGSNSNQLMMALAMLFAFLRFKSRAR